MNFVPFVGKWHEEGERFVEFLDRKEGNGVVYYLPVRYLLGKYPIGWHEESEELDPVYLEGENVEEMLSLFPGFLKKIKKHRRPGLRFWASEARKACGLRVAFQRLHFVEEEKEETLRRF